MNTTDIARFKKKLTDEKALLEKELAKIGRKDTATPGGWDPGKTKLDIDSADDNLIADKLEEMEGNAGILANLEDQLKEVNAALERIDKGTYGVDEKSGKPIDVARLEANPSARFSIK